MPYLLHGVWIANPNVVGLDNQTICGQDQDTISIKDRIEVDHVIRLSRYKDNMLAMANTEMGRQSKNRI